MLLPADRKFLRSIADKPYLLDETIKVQKTKSDDIVRIKPNTLKSLRDLTFGGKDTNLLFLLTTMDIEITQDTINTCYNEAYKPCPIYCKLKSLMPNRSVKVGPLLIHIDDYLFNAPQSVIDFGLKWFKCEAIENLKPFSFRLIDKNNNKDYLNGKVSTSQVLYPTINVTQDDINEALKKKVASDGIVYSCSPLYLSLESKFKKHMVSIREDVIVADKYYELPLVARDFINKWRKDEPVVPIQFELIPIIDDDAHIDV